jgi:hypothetical protein
MKAKLMIARFPGGGSERQECVDWLIDTHMKASRDPRITEVVRWRIADTPITMGRNRCLKVAKEQGCDLVLMVDSDMWPDLYLGHDPSAKSFYDAAMDHVFAHAGPCAVAAPYCGPPPIENIYVFRWGVRESDNPNFGFSLDQYSRDEAAMMGGVQEAAALPTGVFLLDMRGYDVLLEQKQQAVADGYATKPQPMFYYEWTDHHETEKASTEDVTFSRDLSLAGVKVYCAWDSWAAHIKTKIVGKPTPLRPDIVAGGIRSAIVNRTPLAGEKLMEIKRPRFMAPPTAVAADSPPVELSRAN